MMANGTTTGKLTNDQMMQIWQNVTQFKMEN